MQGKGKQFVPHGARVMLAFPGGAGYGDPADRDHAEVRRDLALEAQVPPYVIFHDATLREMAAQRPAPKFEGEL